MEMELHRIVMEVESHEGERKKFTRFVTDDELQDLYNRQNIPEGNYTIINIYD